MVDSKRRERLDRGIKVRTESIFAILSWKEIAYLIAPRAILISILLVLPILMPNMYWQKVICLVGVFSLLAMVFDFLAEHVGLICLGGSLFVGIGGYFTAVLNNWLGIPIYLSIPIATILGATFCTLILIPCFPLRGVYFAIMTLIYPMAAERIIEATGILGSTNGIPGLDGFPNIWFEQYLIIIINLIVLFGLRRLVAKDTGLILKGVKDNDQAIVASGINVDRYKAFATFIAACIGCFVGCYLAHLYNWAGMSLFALDFAIMPIAASIVGGIGTIAGPMLGAFILSPLSEMLRALGGLRIAIYCFILVLFIFFRTEGILNYMQRKYQQTEQWIEV